MAMSFALLLSLAATPLPDGVFWVARAECERVEVKGVLVTVGDVTFNQREGRLFAPFLSTRPNSVALSGTCDDAIPEAPRASTLDECRAQKKRFVLPTCDAAIKELHFLAKLSDVDHEQAQKTLARLTTLMRKGGKLWLRGTCEVVQVKPGKGGQTTLTAANWETEGTLEPLFNRARMQFSRDWVDQGLGGWGHGPSTEPLLLGKGLIVLGTRVLYVDEGDCAAR